MEFQTDIFSQFNDKWALLCAGEGDDFNAMTISWGGMGTLWGKDVVTVYVKPVRYTWQFMERNDYFTVSFYPPECRRALEVMGTKSGRDGDKVSEAGLTPVPVEHGVSFAEAELTMVCRKIYSQDLSRDTMPEKVVQTFYTREEPHRMYVGEVVALLRR